MAWKIGKGNKLVIGKDPWIGCNGNYRLSKPLLLSLHEKGLTRLEDVATYVVFGSGIQGWKSAEDLELQDDQAVEWTQYINLLKHNAICLHDHDDELKWSRNQTTGVLTTKLGYASKFSEEQGAMRLWWWKAVWKLVFPLKTRIFLWLVLENKVLMWDNGQKRNWIGLGWCYLCKQASETVDHLFVLCPFSKVVWMEVLQSYNLQAQWDKASVMECLESWLLDRSISSVKALPCYVLWGIWLTRNKSIFKGKEALVGRLSHQIRLSFGEGKKPPKQIVPRILQDPRIDYTRPWASSMELVKVP
jgi:hypothetical protein